MPKFKATGTTMPFLYARVVCDYFCHPPLWATSATLLRLHLIKPNMRELRELTRKKLENETAWLEACRNLVRAGRAEIVALTLGQHGALLVTRDPVLEGQVTELLADILPVRTCPAVMTPLKKSLEPPPLVILLHWAGGGVQQRHLLKNLAETFPAGGMVLVLGNSGEGEGGRQLSAEIKAAAYVDWNPAQATFFKRLLQGLLRKRWGVQGG